MAGTMWGLLALGGIAVVVASNALRARRTGDMGCLGHFFVASERMTTLEEITNRTGIALFAVGVVAAVVV